MNILKSSHLAGPAFTKATVQSIHADWGKCITRDVADYERMYQDHLTNLRVFLTPKPEAKPKGFFGKLFGITEATEISKEAPYRFAICFASDKFLTGHGARQAAHQQLNLIHNEHLALIDQLLELPDETLTATPLPRATGKLGDVIEAALQAYFYHSDFGPQGKRLRADASLRIPTLLRRFPYLDSNITVSLMDAHPDLTAETASLIHDTFGNPDHKPGQGPYGWIALDMTGFYARREDPFQKHGAKIMAKVLEDAPNWPRDQLDTLMQVFALEPLALRLGTAEEEAQKARDTIAWEEAALAKGFTADGLFSPQRAEQVSRKRMKDAKTRLEQIEADFDSIRADHLNAAAAHLAKANGARKTVEVIAKALPDDLAAPLTEVLAEATKTRPTTFAMPKATDNRFQDLGFKLMVIDELMYTQKRLLPAFDIRTFAKEWTEREISIEDDGYAIIPEAQTYFQNLAIPAELLAHVEIITQKSGLDGEAKVSTQMTPFWDPGCGDGPVPVTDKAVADLDLLPNLKCVIGLDHEINAPAPTKLLTALEDRGINMVNEELALWGRP